MTAPLFLAAALACVGYFLVSMQAGMADNVAEETACSVGATWAGARTSLEDGSWDPASAADGLYAESIGRIPLLGDIVEEAATDHAGLGQLAARYGEVARDPDAAFLRAKMAAVMARLAECMKGAVFPASELRFRLSYSGAFPKDKLSIEITQVFRLPFAGERAVTARAEAQAGSAADFLAGTDLVIDLAKIAAKGAGVIK